MDRREYADDLEESFRAAQDGRQASIWTALPGIIQSFDAAKQTAVVQPTTQIPVSAPDGTSQLVTMPLLLDCPVHFPKGGQCVFTFPVAEGDECLVVFASRCIDGWWQNGGVQAPAEQRMHDLSDGFAYVGVSSVPNVPSDIATDVAELRSLDGATKVALDPAGQVVTIVAPGGVEIQGDVHVTGAITCDDDVTANGVSLHDHTHGGVTAGSDDTGAPN